MVDEASINIPTFVKPKQVRQISNLTCDAQGTSTTSGAAIVDNTTTATMSTNLTFAGQNNLPPLPIPSLEETMTKFLHHMKALEEDLDPEEREETKRVVAEFLEAHPALDSPDASFREKAGTKILGGPQLQKILLEYDSKGRESGEIGSYVEEFWSDAYLAPDASVVLNLNPYFLLEESPDPKLAGNQIRRAASLCFASVKMACQLRNENLKPDTFKGRPLCMDQFRALFGATRKPKLRSRDTIAVCEKSNHVAVMCRNQLFYFQALWPDGDVAVDEGDIVDILEAIWNHAHHRRRPDTKKTGQSSPSSSRKTVQINTNDSGILGENEKEYQDSIVALGVLTSLGRNQWAQAREEMVNFSPKNEESLKIVDSALFVLVLDDYVPKNRHDAAANMLHGSYRLSEWKPDGDITFTEYQSGSCTNRWYDKLQIIVTADGGAGINFEHSAIDGHTALRFVSDIYADTVISFAQSITKLVHAHQGLIPSVITANVRRAAVSLDDQGRTTLDVFPKKINFDFSDSIKQKIYFAETALGDQILASDTHILEFNDYGKRFITYNRLSPDSYVQMSIMLAYYRLYGKIVCAYEPVLTKGFYHGRTEAMRPATMEAKHLCQIFCNPSSSSSEKLTALRNATQAHSKLVKECAQGRGVDRHLFALKCIAEKNNLPIPRFFQSNTWKRLNHTILSTSNCGNPSLALFGFGPVVPDGYGIGYIIKDSHLHYAICSKHRQTTRYALTLEGVLREMASLLEPISNTKVHDHQPQNDLQRRPSLKRLSSDNVSYDSYGDIWGESSFHSILECSKGRPSVIDESGERRWSAEDQVAALSGSEVTFTEAFEESFRMDIGVSNESPPSHEIVPTTSKKNGAREIAESQNTSKSTDDAAGSNDRIVPTSKFKRRGSCDQLPIRPHRRSSGNNPLVGKTSTAEPIQYDHLSRIGNAILFEGEGDK